MRMALHFIAVFREWYLFPTASNRYNADIISLSEYGVGTGAWKGGDVFWGQRGEQTWELCDAVE